MRVSDYFGLKRGQHFLDFVDVPIDTDIPVFLEPLAIKSLNTPWGHELASLLQSFFSAVLVHIKNKRYVEAEGLLAALNERNEFHLGYSKNESRGHGFGELLAKAVRTELSKSRASLTGLLTDLEDTALLVHGIGVDMISDAICNILRGPLIKYTQDMCLYYGIPLTDEVESGPVWNPMSECWNEGTFVPLPMTSEGKLILVPRILVRHQLGVSSDRYYRHHLLPQMQSEHLRRGTALVEVLKNGRKRVTKKRLMSVYGHDKLAVVQQTVGREDVLKQYKRKVAASPPPPLKKAELSKATGSRLPDLRALVRELKATPPGNEHAAKYEDIVEKLFSALFYPHLCNPQKQHELHNGRKRVDLTYMNESKKGFFSWLAQHYTCPLIFFECKNFSSDVANPELDQLAGRFSPSRGRVGFLVMRSAKNKKLLMDRCKDTVHDDRGYIVPITDADIEELVDEYVSDPDNPAFTVLRGRWNILIS